MFMKLDTRICKVRPYDPDLHVHEVGYYAKYMVYVKGKFS